MNVIVKKAGNLSGSVAAPASKSYTQRMVIASALSEGTSHISNPLYSDDTEAALRAVTALCAEFKAENGVWTIKGGKPRAAKKPIDCGESGATLRFMIPVAALADGPSTLLFRGSIERRPVEPLLECLKDLGADAHVVREGDLDAVYVEGGGLVGGKCSIPGDVSSQFISGLMFACPLAQADTEIVLTSALESADYVKMTEAVLSRHAVEVAVEDKRIFIPGNQAYKADDGIVPGDFSSAASLLAAAAITKSKVIISGLDYKAVQGDKAIMRPNIIKKYRILLKVY
jgi:3-phosphoshikimate 1-carboxyvinyltransferase